MASRGFSSLFSILSAVMTADFHLLPNPLLNPGFTHLLLF
ncbi:hypothetical protein ROSINTL182_05094 [Roseburia intestinalis L1-82]|uniref:Uncharacterized protein n=1 Tax=Roseburia intestinalis L1-82 TaxID=536231 RepID=C7G5D6_9FIRM|nr:hypothetical protein ROSINTL182_05094 [Roseburia intestinalis L1-82]